MYTCMYKASYLMAVIIASSRMMMVKTALLGNMRLKRNWVVAGPLYIIFIYKTIRKFFLLRSCLIIYTGLRATTLLVVVLHGIYL
jgi:hypothetical protein